MDTQNSPVSYGTYDCSENKRSASNTCNDKRETRKYNYMDSKRIDKRRKKSWTRRRSHEFFYLTDEYKLLFWDQSGKSYFKKKIY